MKRSEFLGAVKTIIEDNGYDEDLLEDEVSVSELILCWEQGYTPEDAFSSVFD